MLQEALSGLSEFDREVLQLAGFEELSAGEIAVALELSPDVVRNRLSRARARLRDALGTAQSVAAESELPGELS